MSPSKGGDKPPILDVLRHYGYDTPPNPRMGGWSKCRCILPGHDDRHPSASISLESNRFSCHACAVTMDSWEIIMQEENISFGQARQMAEETFNTKTKAPRKQEGRKRERLFD
jgi:DNA primase